MLSGAYSENQVGGEQIWDLFGRGATRVMGGKTNLGYGGQQNFRIDRPHLLNLSGWTKKEITDEDVLS